MRTTAAAEIRFRCDHCGKEQRAPTQLAGRQGKCSRCQGCIRVPGEVTVAKVVDPVAFAHSHGTTESRYTCVLVVEQDALRVIECEGAGAVPEGRAADPRALVEAVAGSASKDARVAFGRLRRVEKEFCGGLKLEYGRSAPKSLDVPLGSAVADEALKHLRQVLKGFNAEEQTVPVAQVIWLPALFAVAVGVFGWGLHAIASALQENSLMMRGRVGLIAKLMELIGPNAFAVVTGVVVALTLLSIVSELLTPPTVPVLSRA